MRQLDFRLFGIIMSLLIVLYLAIVFKVELDTFNNRYFNLSKKLYQIQNNWEQHIHLIKDAIITLHYNNDFISNHIKKESTLINSLLKDKHIKKDYPLLYQSLQKFQIEQTKITNMTYQFIKTNGKIKNSLIILNKRLSLLDSSTDIHYFKKLTQAILYYENQKNDFSYGTFSPYKLDQGYFQYNKLDYIHLSLLNRSIPHLHQLYFDIKNSNIPGLIQRNFALLKQESLIQENKMKRLFYIIMAAYIFFFIIIVFLVKDLKKQTILLREKDKLLYNQAKHAAMGEMIDAIAHQWKQPLSLIHLNTDFLTYMLKDDMLSKEQVKEFQEKVFFQIKHMKETLEQFREFLRPNKDLESFNIQTTIQNVLTLTKDDLIKHGISVEVIVRDNITMDGIANEFKHVILNLINNSKDAFIEQRIEYPKIVITLEENKNIKYIYFEDNAGGIPDEIIGHVFEPNITTKPKGKGTGIGLYMTKQILDKLGAEINVENKNNGCCFTISIKQALL